MSTATLIKNVYEAFGAVMADVRAIEKGDRNQQQGFNFRGIDAVMQVVGPVLRTHGVFIIPTGQELKSETYQTKSNTTMRNVTVTMRFRVYGPSGDSFDGVSFGEAADAGDKAVTKAQSVAYRTFLLQALSVPTGDVDPDAHVHERAVHQEPPPSDPAMDAALEELGDACVVLGLNQGDVAGKFYAKHKKPPRKATPEQVRAFIESLHDAADKPIPYSGKVIKTKPLEDK